MCVEGDGHVQQQFPLLHPSDKVLDADLQVAGCLVDLLGVTLSRLGQLLGCLQQLVSVGVGVLEEKKRRGVVGSPFEDRGNGL